MKLLKVLLASTGSDIKKERGELQCPAETLAKLFPLLDIVLDFEYFYKIHHAVIVWLAQRLNHGLIYKEKKYFRKKLFHNTSQHRGKEKSTLAFLKAEKLILKSTRAKS